jgi:hypothetical protein
VFDVSEEEARRVEQAYRDRDAERLIGQSKSGDLHTLKNRLFGPDNMLDDPSEGQSASASRNASTSAGSID